MGCAERGVGVVVPGASVNDARSLTKVRTSARSYASTLERCKTWMDSSEHLNYLELIF
jgi:hypothetical protein